jgi:SAM-dependent methyltransferase
MPGDSGPADLPAFEEIYARAGDDLASVPWARLAPHPLLVMWLDSADSPGDRPARHAAGQEALVVGCGLGDDAEELAGRGYAVTAFDVSPTAIVRCRERFPRSPACYRVADVLNPPGEWRGRFGLVVEVNTIQSLRRADRPAAIAAIAELSHGAGCCSSAAGPAARTNRTAHKGPGRCAAVNSAGSPQPG